MKNLRRDFGRLQIPSMSPNPVNLLSVRHLSKRFGEYAALTDVNFDVREGEILGLIGANGAGKTTLMECVVGLSPSNRGAVLWRDKMLSIPQRQAVMFYLPDGILPYGDREHLIFAKTLNQC